MRNSRTGAAGKSAQDELQAHLDLPWLDDDVHPAATAASPFGAATTSTTSVDTTLRAEKKKTGSSTGDCSACAEDDVEAMYLRQTLFPAGLRVKSNIFSVSNFTFEFFTQLFHPFLLPWVIHRQGWIGAANKGFVPLYGKHVVFIMHTIFAFMLWVPLIGILAASSVDEKRFGWAVLPIVVSFSFGLFRIMVIAGKYACYPKKAYNELATNRDLNILGNLLIGSWNTKIDEELLRSLVDEAESEARVNLSGMSFLLNDGVTKVPAKAYLTTLVRQTFGTPCNPAFLPVGDKLLTLIVTLLPLFSFFDNANSSNDGYKRTSDGANITWLVVAMFQMLSFSMTNFSFLMIAVVHHQRLYQLEMAHTNAVALLDTPDPDDGMIPVSHRENILVWVHTRSAIKKFARVYSNRISFNMLATLCTAGLLAMTLIHQAFSDVQSLPLISAVAFMFVVFTGGSLAAIYFAYRSNRIGHLLLLDLAQQALVERSITAGVYQQIQAPSSPSAAASIMWGNEATARKDKKKKGRGQQLSALTHKQEEAERTTSPRFGMPSSSKEQARFLPPSMVSTSSAGAAGDPSSSSLSITEVAKEVMARSIETDPACVMFLPATAELASFVLSVFVAGTTLVIGAFAASSARGF